MPLDEFWHGDVRLLEAYHKAYIRDKSFTAWINGCHAFEAHSKAIANGNRTKKSDHVEQYNKWKDPIPEKIIDISKEDLEKEFRESQYNQNCWLFRK